MARLPKMHRASEEARLHQVVDLSNFNRLSERLGCGPRYFG